MIKGVDVVVAAIADDQGSNLLIPSVEREMAWRPHIVHRNEPGIAPLVIVRGSEQDVLSRYLAAAEAVNADVILRVTSDCPLIEPDVCTQVLEARTASGADYASNVMPQTWQHGLDCEAFMSAALREADRHMIRDAEHVTGSLQEASQYKRVNVTKGGVGLSHIRWTLDTIDDYVVICKEFERRMAEGKVAA